MGSAMTYDSESDLIILFGGGVTADYSATYDTWTYDVDSNTWTEKSPTVHPNTMGSLAYDSENDRAVYFGGSTDIVEDDVLSETWIYNCNSDTWTEKSPKTQPEARARGMLAYDNESDRTILLGGVLNGGSADEELLYGCWAYNLNANLWNNVGWDWQEVTPANSPGTRTGSPLTYDIKADRMVIFSGWADLHSGGSRYNDTWTYDYDTDSWTNMSPAVMPEGRGAHSMAYSESDDLLVMFGGVTGYQQSHDDFRADTWTYNLNTNTWTNMSPSTNPSPRMYACMTYDNASDVFVLFGGYLQDYSTSHETWLYNLTANTWTNVTTTGHPPARFHTGFTYDYKNHLSFLVGGASWNGFLNDIWSYDYDTNSWNQFESSTAGPSFGFGAAYNLDLDLFIALGGPKDMAESGLISQTWVFNITSEAERTGYWANAYSQNNPPPRSRLCLAYDIESSRTILYGGALPAEGEALGDTWAYDYRVNPPLASAPQNLVVTQGEGGLVLSWDAPEGSIVISGYRIYKGTQSGAYEESVDIGNMLSYTDLTAGYGITYYYAVVAIVDGNEGELSNEASGLLPFVPADDGVYTFIAYGDTRGADTPVAPVHDDLVSKFVQYDPEMVIHTGDMVLAGGESSQWTTFDNSISAIHDWDSTIPFYGAVGNHEQYTDDYGVIDEDFSTYLGHFDYSDVVDEAGETELYYSWDWRGIHFIVLNSIDGWQDNQFTCPTAQMDWLKGDLANNYGFIVVSLHNPLWSVRANAAGRWAEAESVRNAFHDLFVEYGVDIVFSGHDHQYYRTERDGIQYVVTGGGGAPLYEIQTTGTVWQAGDVGFSAYHYCVCSIDTETNKLSVQVVMLNGAIGDSFALELLPPTAAPFPIELVLITIGVVAVAIVVVVVIVKRRQ
jgi:hypothetical protein